MKLYQALYNHMTYESSAEVISIHRTEVGAGKAITEHKAKDKIEHDKNHTEEVMSQNHAIMRGCGFTEEGIEKYDQEARDDWPKSWQWWGIGEIEVQE